MNKEFFDHAMKVLENMSEEELEQRLITAGFKFIPMDEQHLWKDPVPQETATSLIAIATVMQENNCDFATATTAQYDTRRVELMISPPTGEAIDESRARVLIQMDLDLLIDRDQ